MGTLNNKQAPFLIHLITNLCSISFCTWFCQLWVFSVHITNKETMFIEVMTWFYISISDMWPRPKHFYGNYQTTLLWVFSFIKYGISNISLVDFINHRFGILKSQICMVGDRLDTDILFGQNGGCKTLLVLSGN